MMVLMLVGGGGFGGGRVGMFDSSGFDGAEGGAFNDGSGAGVLRREEEIVRLIGSELMLSLLGRNLAKLFKLMRKLRYCCQMKKTTGKEAMTAMGIEYGSIHMVNVCLSSFQFGDGHGTSDDVDRLLKERNSLNNQVLLQEEEMRNLRNMLAQEVEENRKLQSRLAQEVKENRNLQSLLAQEVKEIRNLHSMLAKEVKEIRNLQMLALEAEEARKLQGPTGKIPKVFKSLNLIPARRETNLTGAMTSRAVKDYR
ncbi:unnamed protein product [Dovyalis caffra]|uniref:Uncharacterized protein n=1 Tax=Dovyalis caffra TaxID=77055 RepID=A0AAV1S5K5_9ROSI|nr:unnamed protein product [Dovyalis caffra]